MTLRPVPPTATWLLKLFCSGTEHESVIGDLSEQYQRGRSAFWYWRQVVAIVFLGSYREAVQRPLVPSRRIPVGSAFALVLLAVGLLGVLGSDVWSVFLIAIVAGLLFGAARFLNTENRRGSPQPARSSAPDIVRIDSSKITVGGGLGVGIIIVILLSGVLHDLPQVRALAIPGILAGLLFAFALRVWRKVHAPTSQVISLGLEEQNGLEAKTRVNKGR